MTHYVIGDTLRQFWLGQALVRSAGMPPTGRTPRSANNQKPLGSRKDHHRRPLHRRGALHRRRAGPVRRSDGRIDLDLALELELAPPPALGGSGDGSNPEQLFAAGYAACFLSALLNVARGRKIVIAGSSVGAWISIGRLDAVAFSLVVESRARHSGPGR
jgi:organic hydroperoxide reductase OsmC/OhrA